MRFLHPNTRKKAVNLIAGIAYFSGAHGFDALYAFVSKECDYFSAIGIMFLTLGGTSALLVSLHGKIKKALGWDILELEHLNRLRGKNIPRKFIIKRFTRWLMRRRMTIFLLGSCFIGPPVVAILLKKPGSMADSIFYILSGTLISVVIWVTVWKGFWSTWTIYFQPALNYLRISI